MDEPTAALAQKEIKTLFRIIRFLKESGLPSFISLIA